MSKVTVHTGGGGGGELPYVVGTYRGNGGSGQYIEIGFVATAVLLEQECGFRNDPNYVTAAVGGLFFQGHPLAYGVAISANMDRNGFSVSGSSNCYSTTYHYIAFR